MNQGAITFQKVHESIVWQASISMSYQRIFSSLKNWGGQNNTRRLAKGQTVSIE